jgi:hypothetical protein
MLARGGQRVELVNPTVLDASDGMALMPALVRPGLRLLRVTRVMRLAATSSSWLGVLTGGRADRHLHHAQRP